MRSLGKITDRKCILCKTLSYEVEHSFCYDNCRSSYLHLREIETAKRIFDKRQANGSDIFQARQDLPTPRLNRRPGEEAA
jgi:hypothetical protein